MRLWYARNVSMKAREKLFIIISVVACGVSIAVFALVSLGHFIYTPNRTVLPVVGKMYESTVQQVSMLETVPVPQPPTPVTNNSVPTPVIASKPTISTSDNSALNQYKAAKNQKYNKKDDKDSDYLSLRKTLEALFAMLN